MRTVSNAPAAKSFLRSLRLIGTGLILTRMPAGECSVDLFLLLLLPDQRTGEDVMQALLALSESHHDVADGKAETGEKFGKETAGGAGKINGVAGQVGYSQSQEVLAHRSLPRRAREQRLIKPFDHHDCRKQCDNKNEDRQERLGIVECYVFQLLGQMQSEHDD